MVIKHISILNLDKAGVSKTNQAASMYSMRVYLSDNPDYLWKGYFKALWWRMFFHKKKNLDFSHNELRILLEKSDDFQNYIESFKSVVERTNKLVLLERERHGAENKRKLKICNSRREKTYKII